MRDADAEQLSVYELGQHSLLFRPRSFDKLVIREIWKWDEYFLGQLAGPALGVIVDVGAHIGAFALKAHERFSGSRVLALEPVQENFELLELNLRRNACSSVTPIKAALQAESGQVQVY